MRNDGCFTLLWPLGCSLAFLLAGTIAVLLRESGRDNVMVSEVPYEPDPDLAKRVWKRIAERLANEGVEMAVFG